MLSKHLLTRSPAPTVKPRWNYGGTGVKEFDLGQWQTHDGPLG